MLISSLLSKSTRYTPLFMTRRWKIRIFPDFKEKYGDDETIFMKKEPKRKKIVVDILSILHRKNLLDAYKEYLKEKKINERKEDQRYLPLRHSTLGPDLATTHFLLLRGGRVKFVGNNHWVTQDDIDNDKVPGRYVPGFYVEEIDASKMDLCYEGFENLSGLSRLKKLNLSYCPLVDDWCLSRCYLFSNTLEYLDLSGCQQVTERGICALHVLTKLRTLVINDTPNILNKELVSLMLQDVIPRCEIIGVNFNDPVLLKTVENYASEQ